MALFPKDLTKTIKIYRSKKQKFYSKLKCAKIFNFKDIVLGKNTVNLLMENKSLDNGIIKTILKKN